MFWKIRLIFFMIFTLLTVACTAANASNEPIEPDAAPIIDEPIPTPYVDTFWTAENIFATILTETTLPDGWQVEPCEGVSAFLCVRKDEEIVGAVELGVYPLESNPNFQAMLAAQQISPESADQVDVHDPAVHSALLALAEDHLKSIAADRQITTPDDPFIRIEPKPIQLGALPGLALGFVHESPAGEVIERYLSHVAFDGRVLYWVTAAYDPANFSTFVSDEMLTEFAATLPEILSNLHLPPPVMETDVHAVNVVGNDVFFTAVYGEGLYGIGVLESISQDDPIPVTGVSPDGRWWRVECTTSLSGICWLPADPQRVRPITANIEG